MDLDSELTGFIEPYQELSDHASNMNTRDPLGNHVLDYLMKCTLKFLTG